MHTQENGSAAAPPPADAGDNAVRPAPGPGTRLSLGPERPTFDALSHWIPEHGDLFVVQSDDRRDPSFVVSRPEYIKHILLTNHENYNKGVGFERVKMLLGNGIIVSNGEEWRRQRTMMQPAFSRASVTRLAEPIRHINLDLRGKWAALAANGTPLDVTTAMSQLGLEVILRSILSSDLDRLVERAGHNPFAFLADDPTRDLQTAVRFRNLASHVMGIITERRATGARPFDFLSMLLDARDKKTGTAMTDRELLDEINTLIIAGHETSAGTLNWAWYLLGRHPDVETRLLAEIEATFRGDDFSFSQLMELNYMACVLKETLRLYPPVWLFSRRAIAADRLGPFEIPAGAHLFIAPYFLHRRPELWPDPERFDPDRFDEARSGPVDRYAFVPFSAGARRCIGEHFSFVEMQMHLALMLPHYALKPVAPAAAAPELEPAVNLRSTHAIHLTISPRHRGVHRPS